MASQRILLVDDDESVARSLARGLQMLGDYHVRVETRGRQAISAAREFRPDLILLDIVMPDMDGGEVAAALAADRELDRVPVVIMTGLVDRDEVDASTTDRAGRRIVAKPVEPAELVRVVREVLGG